MTTIKNKIKQIISSFKYNYSFFKVLNSPFVGLKLNFYFGDIEHGTPYFLPRRWVKCNKKDGLVAWNKLSEADQDCQLNYGTMGEWVKDYTKSYTKPVQIKYFGWNFTSLGWKTKYDDYRFEWNPSLSIVIFGKQLFITILPKNDDGTVSVDSYWEGWLNYYYRTDRTKSKLERLEELVKVYSCTWESTESGSNEGTITDYYLSILKEKYIGDYNRFKEINKIEEV